MAKPCFMMWVAFAIASSAAAASSKTPSGSSAAIFITVDQSGNGHYKRIQHAINAAPSNSTHPIFIWVKPGIYREKIVVPADKTLITLNGTNASTTIITWNESGSIIDSATLSIWGSNFVGRFLTIQNTYGSGARAAALSVSGDRAAFYGCRILSYQDTLVDFTGRHYYSNCYIEGGTDFICGNGLSLFNKCHLHSLSSVGGAITAQRRSSPAEKAGYSFVNCTITGEGNAILGRPWGAYSRVVFAYTYMSNVILPQGWDDWNDPRKRRTVFYGEYRCTGPGSNASGRVGWSRQLSSSEVAPFLTTSMIDGSEWLRSPPLLWLQLRQT